MTRLKKFKKTSALFIRMTPEQKETIEALADAEHMTVSDYARHLLLMRKKTVVREPKQPKPIENPLADNKFITNKGNK